MSLQCLIDICKLFYDIIADLFPKILLLLSDCFKNDDSEICIPALEVLTTIANEEKERIESNVFLKL